MRYASSAIVFRPAASRIGTVKSRNAASMATGSPNIISSYRPHATNGLI